MTWNVAITAFGAVFIVAILVSFLGDGHDEHPTGVLESYLLGGGRLGQVPVVNLLLSTSFGINTMLFQGFLGAKVGYWGLVVQAAWAAGFFLLLPYIPTLKKHRGLHGFLGLHFGKWTRVVASLASLVGITVFLGWETSIGRDGLAGILALQSKGHTSAGANWLIVGIVGGTLLYTVLGGLRGNAIANVIQNVLKWIGFTWVTVLLGVNFFSQPNSSFCHAFFPPLEAMTLNLHWMGLFTSLFYGMVWQFVDMGTWQCLAASSESSDKDIRWNLRMSGVLVFLTPGVLGTIFGVFLANTPHAEANVLVAAASVISNGGVIVAFLFFAAIMAAVMSLIDGLFLASTYAIIVDLMHPNKRLQDLDSNPASASRTLLLARVCVVLVASLSIWAVPVLVAAVGQDLFFFSFVVIVAQLSLFGPIWFGLRDKSNQTTAANARTPQPMWTAIVGSAALGFGLTLYGGSHQQQWLVDGAGSFTILCSLGIAYLVTRASSASVA